MWIKLLMYTTDIIYAKRLANYLDREYGDKTEVKIVSEMEQMIIDSQDADIVIADEEFETEVMDACRRKKIDCPCVFLMEKTYEIEKNVPCVFKYQRGDALYKDILDIYSSYGNVRVSQKHELNSECRIFAFLSPYGGVGTTTVAKAFAKKNAIYEKVLYLNLQPLFSQSEQEKENGLDDIIMALKSRRSILPLKLQSAVGMDQDHVFGFSPSKNPLNVMELNAEDMENLIKGIKDLNSYQKIIIDIGNYFAEKEIALLKIADSIVCVVDHAESNTAAYDKFNSLLKIVQLKDKCRIQKKVELFKNKVMGGMENVFDRYEVKTGGWAPFVKLNTNEEVIERIAQSDSFENLGISYAD